MNSFLPASIGFSSHTHRSITHSQPALRGSGDGGSGRSRRKRASAALAARPWGACTARVGPQGLAGSREGAGGGGEGRLKKSGRWKSRWLSADNARSCAGRPVFLSETGMCCPDGLGARVRESRVA